MFNHVRVENYECHSCKTIQPRCLIIHVVGVTVNLLPVICDQCLETFLMASKPPSTNYELLEIWNMNDG